MTELVGNLTLCLALLAASGATLVTLAACGTESARLIRMGRMLLVVVAASFTLASAALFVALAGSDFQFRYVGEFTERALPLQYKLAAFWAGQEGSLLLWAWMVAVMTVIFAFARRRDTGVQAGASLAAVSFVMLFFAALMLFVANPFKVVTQVPEDGHGLNPMLQDPGMVAHPPLLFLGYAGYTIPFAMMIGALAARRREADWLAAVRPWAIVSWLSLSIGILLGAQWAYVELGWGGYWAWDPVENASLLPWLTGTALLHSIMVQQHRGMFKLWNALLIATTLVLCIFGTYLTRSGVVQSVHAFEQSAIGTFFLVFLGILVLMSLILIVSRRRQLAGEHSLESLVGREGMFLATNVLLVGMMLLTLLGTIFPLISRAASGQDVTVSASYYNHVVAPLGLLLVALMAMGPLLTYGPQAAAKLARGAVVPGTVGAAVVVTLLARGISNPWALVCGAVVGFAVTAIGTDFFRTVRHRMAATRESAAFALLRMLRANHRRYAAQLVHVGVLLIVVGVTGSSLFSTNETHQLKPGLSVTVDGRAIEFVKLQEVRRENFTAVQAEVRVTEPDGQWTVLRPQRRFYDKSEQPNTEAAIRSTWREDVYLNLAGWENGGALTAIQVIVNPLVGLLWTGGIVMTLGGLIGLLPRPADHTRHEEKIQDKRVQKKKNRRRSHRAPALASH